MSIFKSEIITLNISYADSNKNLQPELLYPKIAIFEDTRKFRIVDLSDLTETTYEEENDVVDKIFKDNFLWLVLKSGEIVVLDPVKGVKTKINNDKFKICQIKQYQGELYLVSESGECLIKPFSSDELKIKLDEGVPEILVTLKKTCKPPINEYCTTDGLDVFIEDGIIKTKCPHSGLVDIVTTNAVPEHLITWKNLIVMADKFNMWVIDFKTSEIIYEFGEHSASYIPIMVHNNIFYYILMNSSEVKICSATVSSTQPNNKEQVNTTTQTITSQETLMSQLESLVESILLIRKITEVPSNIQALFGEINNYMFLINKCSELLQFNIIFKSLLYPLQKKIIATEDNKLINLISDLIVKADLLEYIIFKGNECYKDINLFKKNVKDLCITFISKSDLDLASICWLKYSEMKLTMSCDDILEILNSIPQNTKIGAIIIWLKNFIPCLLDENPFHIDIFVRWATERVFKLEQSAYWPKIGIKFIEEVTTVLQMSLKTIPIRPISIDDLDMLKDKILDILELKEKYKIHMLLSEFSSQSPSELSLIMLRRCYTEDLESFLQKYLSFYSTRHQFDLDDALRTFIENEAVSGGGEIDGARLQIVLNMFRSMNGKLDCLLQVLKVLDVPWNETVVQLAVTATTSTNDFTLLEFDYALKNEISKELNYAKR